MSKASGNEKEEIRVRFIREGNKVCVGQKDAEADNEEMTTNLKMCTLPKLFIA